MAKRIVATLFALATITLAQEMNFTLEGKISKTSPGKLEVSSQDNIVFHVRYDEKTEIKRDDGREASAKDLRVGVVIKVDGELTESGEVIAHKIELRRGSSPEPKREKGASHRTACPAS